MFGQSRLSAQERELLIMLVQGGALKAHRDLNGGKEHRLQQLDGVVHGVPARTVGKLRRRGLIASNKKFPAATYLLTDRGRQLVMELGQSNSLPLSTRRYKSSPFE